MTSNVLTASWYEQERENSTVIKLVVENTDIEHTIGQRLCTDIRTGTGYIFYYEEEQNACDHFLVYIYKNKLLLTL